MSINSPFASPYKPGAGVAFRPVATGGMVGRPPLPVFQTPPPNLEQLAAKPPAKKHTFLKTLLYGGAAIGVSALALKKFSPDKFAKVAETAKKYTPSQVGEAKTYLANYAEKLKQGRLIGTALEKAEPLTNGIKSIWKKLAG